jgi:hypothetical protein
MILVLKTNVKHLSLMLILTMLATLSPIPIAAATSVPTDCTTDCHTNNAAFLDSTWFSTKQTPANVTTYVNELAAKKIKYQFADIGVLNDTNTSTNGNLGAANYAGLAQWIKNSRLADPNQLIIITLNHGHRLDRKNGVKVENPNFGNATFNKNLNSLVNKLVNVGVQIGGTGPFYKADGVHLDFEGFMQNDTTLLNTLQYLRSNSLASNNYFSMSTPVDPSYGGITNYQWSNSYISQVAGILNMMNPMIYDQMGWGSDITTAADYQDLWTKEINRYSDAIGSTGPNGVAAQLVPTMPSYETKTSDSTIYHDPLVENLQYAAKGLTASTASPNLANVHGAAIFWWSNFIGRNSTAYNSTLFTSDQNNWMDLWVNHP